MKVQSAIAIFALFWVLTAFVVLPFGIRTHDEAGASKVPGQSDSAPHDFRPWRIVARTTAVASVLFALFLLNFASGWLTPRSLDVFTPEAFR